MDPGAISIPIQEAAGNAPLRILLVLTILALIPGLVISMTAFLRIVVVLGLMRQALGLQQMPPNQVIIGISIFLTYFVMGPSLERIYADSVKPYMRGEVTETEALSRGAGPMRDFMLSQTRDSDLALMANLAKEPEYDTPDDVPMRVVVPAFIVSELRTAFAIGFLLFIPFLVVDLAIAALLNALGMIMLPPTAIALPFKLLIFVLADGWALLVGAVVRSFGGA